MQCTLGVGKRRGMILNLVVMFEEKLLEILGLLFFNWMKVVWD